MIAIAIVAMATIAQAASFDWKTSATGKIYEAGTTTLLASGTAYIFDAASVSQQAVLSAFLDDKTWTTGNLDSKAVSAGVIAATKGEAFDHGTAGNNYSYYVALVNGDNIFISDTVSVGASDVGFETASFALKTPSQAAATALEKTGSFAGGGWYTQSVPEPTSGLLMLLGMAGLALRRRRA